jgi:hypothetical protein
VVIQLSFKAFHRASVIPRKFGKAKLKGTAARLYNIFSAHDSLGPSRAIRFMYRGGGHCLATAEFLLQRELAAIVTII